MEGYEVRLRMTIDKREQEQARDEILLASSASRTGGYWR